MKKLFLVLVWCSLVFMAGCGRKEPMTGEEFRTAFEEKGYFVNEIQYERWTQYQAQKGSSFAQFFVYQDIQGAEERFEIISTGLTERGGEALKKIEKQTDTIVIADYSPDKGWVFRIDNTVFYVVARDGDVKEAQAIIKALGF